MLNAVVIVMFIVCSAVMEECLVLNLCWCVWFCKLCVIYGRMIFSSVLAIGD